MVKTEAVPQCLSPGKPFSTYAEFPALGLGWPGNVADHSNSYLCFTRDRMGDPDSSGRPTVPSLGTYNHSTQIGVSLRPR